MRWPSVVRFSTISLQARISRERSPVPASGAATDVMGTFGVGTVVVLRDLQARPELNGKTGLNVMNGVTGLDATNG